VLLKKMSLSSTAQRYMGQNLFSLAELVAHATPSPTAATLLSENFAAASKQHSRAPSV